MRNQKIDKQEGDNMDGPTKEFLGKDFEQAYENMRATDTKRDAIIAFYAGLVTLILGGIFQNNNEPLKHPELLSLGLFFLWSVGFIILGVLIKYRFWHSQWMEWTNKKCKEILNGGTGKVKCELGHLVIEPLTIFWGTEFSILFLHVFINSIVAGISAVYFTGLTLSYESIPIIISVGGINLSYLILWYYCELKFSQDFEERHPGTEKKDLELKYRQKLTLYIIPIFIAIIVISAILANSTIAYISTVVLIVYVVSTFLWLRWR